ncbi:MAG: D-alanine--poly(phosphoribitol) ligase [Candidatus Rokuibacteriota bacterium]|nr:MAG: D-alanine--poly(phosphoribitol) ligase [Candidatus Rokubacteria bacterium]
MPELLQEWVTLQAERQPGVAVVGNNERLTYARLEERSNQLARLLKEAGCKSGDRVCLLMPKSPTAIVSLLGIYKADCLYVPLDPAGPAARLAQIIQSCGSRWILAAGPVSGVLGALVDDERFRGSISVGWMGDGAAHGKFRTDFTRDDVESYPSAVLHYDHGGGDPAHLLFTSGSTGTPKGVTITHASVIRFVQWSTKYFGMVASDRVSGHSPLHFDLSIFDIFGAFAVGAELHLVPPELNVLPHKLAEFIRSAELTQWFSVPSVLTYMAKFDVVRVDDFPSLKRLLWCGEVFSTPALIHWMRRLPHVTFTNLYGPTEATIASSYYTVARCPEDERAPVPIGRACDGEELLVLDEGLRPVRPGEAGELHIAGAGLSPGYWGDPEKTRAAFPRRPGSADPGDRLYKTGDAAKVGADGLVYFLGRADSQIKSRGYRIELEEIEAALNALPDVGECAVVAVQTDGFEGAVVCCAYVPASGADGSPLAVRQALSAALPTYMLPARWRVLDRLPRNANGKIDRRHVTEAFASHGGPAGGVG